LGLNEKADLVRHGDKWGRVVLQCAFATATIKEERKLEKNCKLAEINLKKYHLEEGWGKVNGNMWFCSMWNQRFHTIPPVGRRMEEIVVVEEEGNNDENDDDD